MNLYQAFLTVSAPEELESHTTGINAISVLMKRKQEWKMENKKEIVLENEKLQKCRNEKCKLPSSVSHLPQADNSLRRRIRNRCCCFRGRNDRPPPTI